MSTPHTHSARLVPQPNALALIPSALASAHRILPLTATDRQIVCAGSGVLDIDFLTRLQFRLQRHLTVVRVPEDIFCEAFEKQYGAREVPQAEPFLDSLCVESPELRGEPSGNAIDWARQSCKVTAVVGCSGGVGATTLAANLSALLGCRNQMVALLDANFSRPAAHIALGSRPAFTIRDLARKKVGAWESLATGSGGVRIIAGEPGAAECANYGYAQIAEFGVAPDQLASHFDHYLIDLPGSAGESAFSLAARANQILLVTTLEPADQHNAMVWTKAFLCKHPSAKIRVVYNRSRSDRECKLAFLKLQAFLESDSVQFGGAIPESKWSDKAWSCRTPLARWKPNDAASKSLKALADREFPNLSAFEPAANPSHAATA